MVQLAVKLNQKHRGKPLLFKPLLFHDEWSGFTTPDTHAMTGYEPTQTFFTSWLKCYMIIIRLQHPIPIGQTSAFRLVSHTIGTSSWKFTNLTQVKETIEDSLETLEMIRALNSQTDFYHHGVSANLTISWEHDRFLLLCVLCLNLFYWLNDSFYLKVFVCCGRRLWIHLGVVSLQL